MTVQYSNQLMINILPLPLRLQTTSSSSSSSLFHAISKDLLRPLPPPFSIVHRSWQVFKSKSRIGKSSCMQVLAGHLAFARPSDGVHESKSLMSSSLLFQQCPACPIHLTWIVFMMVGKWPNTAVLLGVATRTCLIFRVAFMFSYNQAFSSYAWLMSMQCIHTAVSTRTLLGDKCVSFYLSGMTSI